MPRIVAPHVPSGRMAALGQPVLTVDNDLIVRPFEPADIDAVITAYADPEIQRWHHLRLADSAEAQAWIAQWPATWESETDGCWAIASRATPDLVGRIGLREVNLAEGRAEVTYWVLPHGRGRGVATAAVTAVSYWLFDELAMRRIEIVHSEDNTASCRVATKAGFAPEGTMRGALRHADGWHDMHLHARLDTDP